MILDTLTRADRYFGDHPLFARAFAWLRQTDLLALPTGRQVLDGGHLYANVDEYTTRSVEQCRLEAHRRYLDIQYMVRGVEQIGHTPLEGLEVLTPYDESRDVGFYQAGPEAWRRSGSSRDFDRLTLHQGMFAIFAPQDAHAPQIAVGEPRPVRKIVVKVAC